MSDKASAYLRKVEKVTRVLHYVGKDFVTTKILRNPRPQDNIYNGLVQRISSPKGKTPGWISGRESTGRGQ